MAGEWLKFDSSLPDKPETLAITAAMGWDDPDLTVGKLMRLFRWFDQQTVDGNARGVTPALLDRVVGVSGFVQALQNVGWIVAVDGGLALHNFEKHNGKTAKSRAQTAVRVANHRASEGAGQGGNAASVTPALAREEKRREEKKKETVESVCRTAAPPARATKKCPESFALTDELRSWASTNAPLIDAEAETAKFRDYTFSTARTDWAGTWRNWLRKASEAAQRRHSPSGKGLPTFRERDAQARAQRVKEMTGGLIDQTRPSADVIDMEVPRAIALR